MTRFDEQPSVVTRMWLALGLGLVWLVIASLLNDYALKSGSLLVSCVTGIAIGIGLALTMAFFPSEADGPASADNPPLGLAALAKKYLLFVLAGLVVLKVAHDLASGMAAGEHQAYHMLGFLLGLVPLSMLIPKLRLGRKV
ncbi:MAG: hypothetical protein RL299_152 [Pseudomonadota bacterium]|jgi:hypothetical protein